MQKDPFDNIERKRLSKNFVDVILRLFAFGNSGSLIGFIAWIIAITLQILSVGAKLLTRRKLGIRTAGRVRFFVHFILVFGFVWWLPLIQNTVTPSDATTVSFLAWIYLTIYLGLITILWVKNFIGFKNRKGIEGYSFFRGYGFFTSISTPDSKRNRWLRLIDPFILGVLVWAGQYFLGSSFLLTATLLSISSVILFIEECLYIYDEYNFDLDMRDAISLAEDKAKSNDLLNSDY